MSRCAPLCRRAAARRSSCVGVCVWAVGDCQQRCFAQLTALHMVRVLELRATPSPPPSLCQTAKPPPATHSAFPTPPLQLFLLLQRYGQREQSCALPRLQAHPGPEGQLHCSRLPHRHDRGGQPCRLLRGPHSEYPSLRGARQAEARRQSRASWRQGRTRAPRGVRPSLLAGLRRRGGGRRRPRQRWRQSGCQWHGPPG